MSEFLWILLGLLYFAALVLLGGWTLRKGHYILFLFGLFIPALWLVGTVIPPTRRAAVAP